jgi:glycosyltransferase involved in cell wall biosynthesis
MKRRMAILLHGGIGTGHFAQGYPMLQTIVNSLANKSDVVVYSLAAPSEGYIPERFIFRTPPSSAHSALLRWLSLIRMLVRDHRQTKFELLFAFWGYPAGLLTVIIGKFLRVPSAVYVLGADAAGIKAINFGIMHHFFRGRTARWAYRNADLLLGISEYQADQLRKFGVRRNIHVLPWGADPQLYPFESKPRKDTLHCIHVGHSTRVKDQATLLRAFALIAKQTPARLRIIGHDDGIQPELKKLCRELVIDTQVEFIPMVPYAEMPSYYRWADIMLHTSLSEGQSMALTEAAASGILMAGTPVGLLYDLGEACSVHVDFGDYRALAKRVLELLQRPEEWNKKILLARAWSVNHDIHWTMKRLESLLNDL